MEAIRRFPEEDCAFSRSASVDRSILWSPHGRTPDQILIRATSDHASDMIQSKSSPRIYTVVIKLTFPCSRPELQSKARTRLPNLNDRVKSASPSDGCST